MDLKNQKIESVLHKMQSFEPNGVFARNLKECLIIQLQNDNKLTDSKKQIIENLELLEKKLKRITKDYWSKRRRTQRKYKKY